MPPTLTSRARFTSWRMAVVFAAGVFITGMIVSFAGITANPTGVFIPENVPALTLPSWIFWVVWLVIYPCMGVATWCIWRLRQQADVSIPLVLFTVTLLQNFSFWLSTNVAMTTVIDATGLLLAYTLAWVYGWNDKAAACWLAPLLVWMPITTLFKVWLWMMNIV